jgi:hypothetical protein
VGALLPGALLVTVLLVTGLLVTGLLVTGLLVTGLLVTTLLVGVLLAGCTDCAGDAERDRRNGRTAPRNLSRFLGGPGVLMVERSRVSELTITLT